MIQIILIVMGIFACVRLPGLLKLSPASHSGQGAPADPDAFAKWRKVEISAAVWLIVATIGVAVVQLIGGVLLGALLVASNASKNTTDRAATTFVVSTFALMLCCLVIAAIRGSQAKKLKMAAGIRWPR